MPDANKTQWLDRIANGRTDLVFDSLAAGIAAKTADAGGVRLVGHCAYYGDVSAIRALLAAGETLTALGDNLGLNGAAFHGHWQLCEFLLEHGADVNAIEADTGETALHAALSASGRPGCALVVRVLLRFGANVNACTRVGAATGAFMRDVRTRGETPLHRAAAFASLETIELLLQAGAAIEARDANDDSPLSWASWHLRPDAILRALCHGAFRIHPQRPSMEQALLGKPYAGI